MKDKPCLWFFPYDNDSYAYGDHSPDYRLQYLQGIVARENHILDGRATDFFICLHLALPEKDLTTDTQPYADPEGSYFDRIFVDELLLHRPYQKDEVEKVEIYAYTESFLRKYNVVKSITLDEAALLIEPLLDTKTPIKESPLCKTLTISNTISHPSSPFSRFQSSPPPASSAQPFSNSTTNPSPPSPSSSSPSPP